MSGLGVGHVASPTPAPSTLARRPLHLSCSLAHKLQIWTADIISAVEFDSTGNYLATGDKGGRVVLFERNDMVRSPHPSDSLVSALPAVANDVLLSICETHIHFDLLEKKLRIQILHRVSVARARV